MADAVATAAPAAADNVAAQEQGRSWTSIIFGMFKQMLMFYFISSMLKGWGGGQNSSNSTSPANVHKLPPSVNLFPPGQLFDLYLYLDETDLHFKNFENRKLFGQKKGLRYGDWTGGPNNDGSYVFKKTFPTPEVLLRNQSLFLHTFIVKSGQSPDPADKNYVRREVIYGVQQLNRYKKKHYKKTANLLTGVSEQSEEDLAKAEIMKFEILNFWHPNISINIVDDQTNWAKGSLPPPLDKAVKFSPIGDFYQPILFFNTYWNLGVDYMPINETVTELDLSVTFYPISLFKYQMYASQNMKSQWSDLLQSEKEDDDSIKVALLETNPILLGITVVVSILHTVLELLAFKNDIQFWKNRKDLVGLSVRSVLFNIFQSLIVFLYICDNETNFVVKMSVGIGLLIECWKIPKVLNVEVDRENTLFGVFPRLKFSDKGSYVESDTKTYDQMAFRYLSWVLFPLLVGYAIYSIIYVEQKGWYSWVLNMLYGYLLMFGFITMTPQLFINYKLKSVAHLPWRMMTYKFINTFIDDLFAFVIKMPTLYRLGCFRDDIIFLIYLYQRWIYRVDPTRMNEYGTSGENENGTPKPVEGSQETKMEGESSAIKESKKDK
uniref:Cleft lip and palate transmembrane protein 1 n=1 Tax=Caenorhabditis japonica TaxID=281687 RepID=A0A8R1I4M3_CAEJA